MVGQMYIERLVGRIGMGALCFFCVDFVSLNVRWDMVYYGNEAKGGERVAAG